MPARLALSLFGLCVFSLAACGGSSGSGVGSDPAASYDLSGTWSGSFISDLGTRGTATLKLTQQGADVSGSVEARNSCIGGGKFQATLSGDALSGSLTAGAVHADLDGTVASEEQLDGTYTLPAAGACPGDTGSFHFTR